MVVIVEFWAEIQGGKGMIFDGKVPVADSVSQEFDGCIQQELFQVSFKTSLPPGRQKITFPFAFALSTVDEKAPAEADEPKP